MLNLLGSRPRQESRWWLRMAAWVLASVLCLRPWAPARAEGGVFAYRFEDYKEDGDRMHIQTQSVLFDTPVTSWLSLRGTAVRDAISGFTPTGSPPPSQINFVPPGLGGPTGPFSTSVPLAPMNDLRYAGSLEPTFTLGPNRITPGFAYSTEHDYLSYGASLNYARELNQKNTTLDFGWAHDFDTVLPRGFLRQEEGKGSDQIHAGINQLLDPQTIVSLDLTYGYDRGYLADQYKGVLFANETQVSAQYPALEAENRPGYRNRFSALVSGIREVPSLHASVEAGYRLYVDSYGIFAHTLDLAWHQKLGKRLVFTPGFRYYWQSAADFYGVQFPDYNTRPAYYSSDYRLSRMCTLTGGAELNYRVLDWLTLDAAAKYYVMIGLDGRTSSTAYPAAQIITLGARIWF